MHDFVQSLHFTRRSLFSKSGLTMLSESVGIVDGITSSHVYAPWSIVETTCAGQVVTDLRASWDPVVLRRCTAKDTSERRYHGGTPRSETASRPGLGFRYIQRGTLIVCQWLCLLLVLLGLANFVLPQQVEKKNHSEPHESAAEI